MTYEAKNSNKRLTLSDKIYLASAASGILFSIYLYVHYTSGIALALAGILVSLSVVMGIIYPFGCTKNRAQA